MVNGVLEDEALKRALPEAAFDEDMINWSKGIVQKAVHKDVYGFLQGDVRRNVGATGCHLFFRWSLSSKDSSISFSRTVKGFTSRKGRKNR